MKLTTPLGSEVTQLKAGDHILLSGTVYTARDEAHIKMQEKGIPFSPEGSVIYHCGPVIQEQNVIAAGPTTSARMNSLSGFLIDSGVRAFIGKGGMGDEFRHQIKGKAVYLAYTGGCAALAAARMKCTGVYYSELGMAEAVWELVLDELPLVVAIDSEGNDLFLDVSTKAKSQFLERWNTKKADETRY